MTYAMLAHAGLHLHPHGLDLGFTLLGLLAVVLVVLAAFRIRRSTRP